MGIDCLSEVCGALFYRITRRATAYPHPATQNVGGHVVLLEDGAQAEVHELDGGDAAFLSAGLQQNVLEL